MKRRLLRIGLASCLGVSLAVMLVGLLALPTPTRAALLCVHPSGGEGCAYTTIQAAVDVALPGDVISITAGTYTENVVIDKPLTFTGAGATVLL